MTQERQSQRFLLLYALAWAGGAAAYIPLLTVLLPKRVEGLAGADAVQWLGMIAFAGAVAASLANILAGMLSDRLRRRRAPVLAGLVLYSLLTPLFGLVDTLPEMLVLVVAWQCALNLILAPLAALAGDYVPDRQKGFLGGLMACAPAAGALVGALVTLRGLAAFEGRLWLVTALVVSSVLPLLVIGRPRPMPHLTAENSPADTEIDDIDRVRVARMWIARLCVQIAEATLFAFLYLWLSDFDARFDDAAVAQLFMVMLALGIPASLMVGKWSDRHDQPILPLRIAAWIAAAGLAAMALAITTTQALVAYAVFTLATTVFLSIHSAQILRVLPRPERRGRDLGFFNLTNTVPSLVMPWLTVAMVPTLGFAGLFWLLAVLAAVAPLVLPRR